MGNLQILVLALLLCIITTSPTYGQYYSNSVPYTQKKLMTTHLHFYFHDTITGKNPSAVQIARANTTIPPNFFGGMFAIDDPLTVGPDPSSEVIGSAQGIYVSTSRDSLSLVSYYSLGFTAGKFNGSSLNLFSRNAITTEVVRELAVVGGTGKFRLATGFALIKNTFYNPTTFNAIVEYNATVIHY